MSSISLISATYENVADIRLDQDIVVSVDLENVLHDDIYGIEADISNGDTVVTLRNHAVNDVAIAGNRNGKVRFLLPEQVSGKSRHFMIRLDSPKQCAYDFIEGDSYASVQLQSSFGKLLSVDESMTSSIMVLDCYEVSQQPTTLYVDVDAGLSAVSLERASKI